MLSREKVRELEEERSHLQDSLAYFREREERTRSLLATTSQDQGVLQLMDTVRQAQQAELTLKEKVGLIIPHTSTVLLCHFSSLVMNLCSAGRSLIYHCFAGSILKPA